AQLGVSAVYLGSAGHFAVLGKSGVSTVPPSAVVGDVGVSPVDAIEMTGFSLALDASGQFSTSSQVVGLCYAADYAAPTPATLTAAVSAMEAAYTDAASRVTTDPSKVNVGAGTIGGMTLTSGVYSWTVNVQFSTDLTLTGGPNAVFILKTTGIISVGAGVRVILTGGVEAKNIFWQVAGNVAVGAAAHVAGIFLVKTEVALVTGATMHGRIFAQTTVSLQKATVNSTNTVNNPTAAPTPIPRPHRRPARRTPRRPVRRPRRRPSDGCSDAQSDGRANA
ncbi:ice-binding protein, partial [Pelagophyceae sp. CCMP2097]